jgi:hypothetical protein
MVSAKPPILRDEVKDFANAMERVLLANDEEKGDSWKAMPLATLRTLLDREIMEWGAARQNYITIEKKELLDIANMAMMVYHRLK